ncbi:hypothetical protein TREES_T100012908 [Tupaia chinensis]|uniref:Uncharacterized protein n=1 Tax=Tupaia chinensis TaxID=246437 RepID=L9L5V0_TUPCH|nr:hypothetical protein TREES_T100012908 [Tupaia chinensis]
MKENRTVAVSPCGTSPRTVGLAVLRLMEALSFLGEAAADAVASFKPQPSPGLCPTTVSPQRQSWGQMWAPQPSTASQWLSGQMLVHREQVEKFSVIPLLFPCLHLHLPIGEPRPP